MKWVRVVLISGGIALLAAGMMLFAPAWESRGWKEAEGVVTGHRVVSVYHWKTARPAVRVNYAWQVDGVKFQGDRFSHSRSVPGLPGESPERVMEDFRKSPAMGKWRIGAKVAVFYDPRNPSEAVLEKGQGGLGAGLGVLGAGIALCGVFAKGGRVTRKARA